MKYISIGYPLRFDDNMDYLIELNNQIVKLTQDEFRGWCYIKDDNSDEVIIRLAKRGVVITGDNDVDIIKKILTKKLIRQGYGLAQDNKHCIYLGESCSYPSQVQYDIWLKSNGENKIMDIFSSLSGGYEFLFAELRELIEHDLIFVR